MSESPLAVQVGGSHYKRYAIQPVEFAETNDLSACQASILKYILRYAEKDGDQDLLKAAHYCDLMSQIADERGLCWNTRGIEWREDAGFPVITVDEFIDENRLPVFVATVMQLMCITPNPNRMEAAKKEIVEQAWLLRLQAGTA